VAPTLLLETKLYLPRSPRGLVSRPRLVERLDRGAASTLLLVSAPAGFGKTTLLTEWLAAGSTDEHSVAWLSLDRGDNSPGVFWTYTIAALQTVAPTVGESALALLRASQPVPIDQREVRDPCREPGEPGRAPRVPGIRRREGGHRQDLPV
jgi:ATP/maltotriose-dependent transcriptional regulator MalT